MKMSFRKNPIEKIGSDTFAVDFKQAEKLGIQLFQDHENPIIFSAVAVSMDGSLYLNTKHVDYQRLRGVYELFNDASTENMIKIYKSYDTKYPNIREWNDAEEYVGDAKGDVMIKIMLKYELLRREYKAAMVQPLMNLLFHGESDQ